ncbi:hypothetical protein BUE76_00895 [Cnuella takakiae]|nr:hypothetical protein BUE76_00895 [Cnuella takakiae]
MPSGGPAILMAGGTELRRIDHTNKWLENKRAGLIRFETGSFIFHHWIVSGCIVSTMLKQQD